MKAKVFLLFLLMPFFMGISQQTVVDSLQSLLHKKGIEDTVRVFYMLNLSHALSTSDRQKAQHVATEAMQLSKKKQWNEGIAKAYRQQGNIFYLNSAPNEAIKQYHKALDATGFKGKQMFDASVYNNIANIYADLEDYERALKNYREFLRIAQKTHSKPQQLIAIFNIATVQMDQKKDSLAIENLKQALLLTEEKNLNMYFPTVCNNLGLAYEHLNDTIKALHYYKKGLQVSKEKEDKATQAILLTNMGKIHAAKNNVDKAESMLLKSIELTSEIGSKGREAEAWLALSETYQKKGNGKEALNTYKKHIFLKDSLRSNEEELELVKNDLKYEHEKKQALSQAEIERQRTIKKAAIIGGSGLFAALLLIGFIYKKKRDAVDAKILSQFESKVNKTKLKALRSQMNPHFIFNSLNSINDFISKNEKEEASSYLLKFAKLMRKTLENSEKESITLKEDLELIRNYFEIEQKRLQKKFTFHITVDPEIDVENTLVPPLILQPFVENSIWHGMSQKKGVGNISVIVQKKEDMILYSIDDNGVGREVQFSKQNSAKTSFGMKLTRSRIAIISKRKNVNGEVRMIDKKQGMRVEVELPLKLAF